MFQKELTLIKQVCQKNVCFVIIGVLKMLDLNLNLHVCNKCNNVLMTAYELKNIAILSVIKVLILDVFYEVLVGIRLLIG